jgi:hypothetical protein
MKQAILITGYKNQEQLNALINFFPETFNIYIHWDVRSSFKKTEYLNKKNIFIYQKYKIKYAGLNHLKAILFLCKVATQNEENQYFHLITGEDCPLKPISHFNKIQFSSQHLEFFKLPNEKWQCKGYDRYFIYRLNDIFDLKSNFGAKVNDYIYRIQKLFKIKRSQIDYFESLYGGSTYWSLNRESIEIVINSPYGKRFLKRLKYTFAPEEIYFQTILLNTSNSFFENNNLRYIDWRNSQKGSPKFLKYSEINNIQGSYLFARKVEIDTLEKVLAQLNC